MKKFILNIFKFSSVFILPVILFFIYAEIFLSSYPTIFKLKADYLNSNRSNIEILTLGSSHNKDAFNPEYITNYKMANIAFDGQDFKIDSALFSNFIKKMPNLKAVVFELSYHSLEHRNEEDYFRNTMYLRYYDLNLFSRKIFLNDYSIYLSNPKWYTRFLNPFKEKAPLNKYGSLKSFFSLGDNPQVFSDYNFESKIIDADSTNELIIRHKYEDLSVYKKKYCCYDSYG